MCVLISLCIHTFIDSPERFTQKFGAITGQRVSITGNVIKTVFSLDDQHNRSTCDNRGGYSSFDVRLCTVLCTV